MNYTSLAIIGARIRSLRLENDMQVRELADAARLSAAHIYRLEKDKRPNASAVTVASVAIALGTNVEYILGITDDDRCIHNLFTNP